MAIIPADEKVFMVSKSTNTTYSGSASLKAMQEWYTMQDVIDTVGGGGGTPTLQQVVDAGNEATNTIIINPQPNQAALEITGAEGYDAITVNSTNGAGIVITSNEGYGGYFSSNNYSAIYAYTGAGTAPVMHVTHGADGAGIQIETSEVGLDVSAQNNNAISAYSENSAAITASSGGSNAIYAVGNAASAIYVESTDAYGLEAYSQNNYGVFGSSNEDTGVYGNSYVGTGVTGYSVGGFGGYFNSEENSYGLVAAPNAAKPGGGSWAAYSDSRVKKNVKPYTKGLNEILLVNPVNYEYNGLANTLEGTEYTGVIAQEIKEIFPETVSTYKAKLNKEDEELTELYDFTSTALTFALINAVKELKAEIDLLKAK